MTPERLDSLNRRLEQAARPSSSYGNTIIVHIDDMQALLDAHRERDKLRGILRGVEFSNYTCFNACRGTDAVFCGPGAPHCPSCGMRKNKGHADNCELAEVLG